MGSTKSFIENMDMVHFLCQREVEQLQRNLASYMLDSARMRHIIPCTMDNEENVTAYTLMAYDNYMSNMEIITDMARKFNIHLQLKKFNKAVTDYCQSPRRSFKDYLQWNIYRDQYAKNYDLNFEGVKQFGLKKNCLSIDKNKELPAGRDITQFDRESEAFPFNDRSFDQENFSENLGQNSAFNLVFKQLTKFEEDYEFTAIISYVEDCVNLIFYVCELNSTVLELSSMRHLRQLESPPSNSNEVFGVSIHNDNILRAVVYSDVRTPSLQKVLLIDFGEVVILDDSCILYEVPSKYQNVPMQAIKCVLVGVDQITQSDDHIKLGSVLRQNEFKLCSFRVVHNSNRVLHVLFLQNRPEKEDATKFESCLSAEEIHINQLNPFLTFSDENDDLKNTFQVGQLSSETTIKKSIPYNISTLPGSELVSQDDAKYSNSEVPSDPLEEKVLQPKLSADSCVIVTATYVADIEHFFARIEHGQDELLEPLIWTDNEISETQRLVRPPQLHDVVLAKYNKDEFWYRAKVVEIDEINSLFKVFYVDYGNSEIINLRRMAQCLPAHIGEPFRAVPCRLADICALNDSNEEQQQHAVYLVSLVILNQSFAVNVLNRNQDELLVRIIDEEYAEMTKNLVTMGYAKENIFKHEEI